MVKLEFVDAYLQLKDPSLPGFHYPVLGPDATHPNLGKHLDRLKGKRHLVDDYLKEARPANVVAAIHVETIAETAHPAMEVEWVQSEADRTGFPQGIVGLANLQDPKAEATLERHLRSPYLRGIRHRSDDDFLTDPAFHRGYALLGKYRLAGVIGVRPGNSTKIRDLALRFPDIPLNVNHCALYLNKPVPRTPEYLQNWKTNIAILAQAENIFCEMSGVPSFDHNWTLESLRPWILTCIETFGTRRCVFGLHWPMDNLFSSLEKLVGAYAEIIAGFTPDEQQDLFARNALRFYRVEPTKGQPKY